MKRILVALTLALAAALPAVAAAGVRIARVDTAVEFSNLAVLNSTWVQSVFLAAHIFAHGPPVRS